MIFGLLILLLGFSRLYGLTWGLPYYFHPDENNIASALGGLHCPSVFNLRTCFEPGFYAYGQIFLYLGYGLNWCLNNPNLSLRFLSALCSIVAGLVFYGLLKRDFKTVSAGFIGLLIYITTVLFIQLAHFGTTESLSILLLVLAFYHRKQPKLLGFWVGLLAAVKISQAAMTVLVLLSYFRYWRRLRVLVLSLLVAGVTFWIFTPHYFLNWPLFLSALNYEIGVGTGHASVFYTEQFRHIQPLWFTIEKVLVPAFGPGLLLLIPPGIISLLRRRRLYFLWLLMLVFLQTLITFAKWARFFILLGPILIYVGVAGLIWLTSGFKKRRFLLVVLIMLQLYSAINFFQIYFLTDIRIQADKWIRQHLPKKARIITETANVYDLPFAKTDFLVTGLFLYDLDTIKEKSQEAQKLLSQVDYVIVPSRRVYFNYTCYRFNRDQVITERDCNKDQQFPEINRYYRRLFTSGEFRLVKTFQILSDEGNEETFSVFDHPTVRIYRRRL